MAKSKQQSAAQRREKQRQQRQQRQQRLEGVQTTSQPVKRPSGPRMRRRGWDQRYMVGIVLLLLAVVIVAYIFLSRLSSQAGAPAPTPVSSQVLNAVTHVDPNILAAVGTDSVQSPVKLVSGSGSLPPLTGATGKPEFLYVGAEYCPYCAAERWSMVVALSRFGTFSQLYQTTSSASDVYPSTPTFSFYSKLYKGPFYTSQYIDFVAVEELGNVPDSSGNYPTLQTPTTQQQQLLSTLDPTGNIPFVDIGNKFAGAGLGQGFSPQDLANMQVSDIANNLSKTSSTATQHILGTANYLTAAICNVTQQQPASVCSTSAIQKIEQTLNKSALNANGTQIALAVSLEAALRREML